MKNDSALKLVRYIDDNGVGVTDWEAEFLDSLMKSLESNRGLETTEKQDKILDRMMAQRIKGRNHRARRYEEEDEQDAPQAQYY